MRGASYICGLGNPGSRYEHTRHNLGFEALDLLAGRICSGWDLPYENASVARGDIQGNRVILLKPLTYVNASGDALHHFEDLSSENILVVCDDINLQLGTLRIKRSGGSGGHKGLESIASHFGSDSFSRLRMGIGPPPDPGLWADFVLERFTDKEMPLVNSMKEKAAKAVEIIVTSGIQQAMQIYNKKDES